MKKYITGKNGLRVNVPDDTVSCGALCVKVDVPAGLITASMRFMRFNYDEGQRENGLRAGDYGWLVIRSPVAYPSGAVLTVTPSTRWPFHSYPVTYSFYDVNWNHIATPIHVEDFTLTGAITISNMPAGTASVELYGMVYAIEVEETFCATLTAPEGFGNGLSDCATVTPAAL